MRALFNHEFKIAGGALIYTFAFGISALLGVLRQILFNAQFGADLEASAYYAAFRLPETLANLLAGVTLAGALTPVLLRTARQDGGDAAAQRLASLVLTTLLACVAPFALLVGLVAPWFVRYVLAPGFDAEAAQLTATLTRLMLSELLLQIVVAVCSTLLTSRSRFLLPALAIAAHNLTLIGGIVAAMLVPGLGIYGPVLGVISDSLLQLAILVPGLRAWGWRYRPLWQPRERRLREVLRLLLPRGLSSVVNYAGGIVDTAFASLTGIVAALPALYNAFLLIGFPLRLIGLACAQAAFPRLAALAAAGEWRALRGLTVRVLLVVGWLGLAAALGLTLLGRLAIRLLFERGRFDAAAGDLTYSLLVAYAVALPAYISSELINAGLAALYDTRTPLLTNCLQLAARIALLALLIDVYGVRAVPLVFALTALVETLALGLVLFWKLNRRIRATGTLPL
jgi:putative peptidoglycan lipid II flippase